MYSSVSPCAKFIKGAKFIRYQHRSDCLTVHQNWNFLLRQCAIQPRVRVRVHSTSQARVLGKPHTGLNCVFYATPNWEIRSYWITTGNAFLEQHLEQELFQVYDDSAVVTEISLVFNGNWRNFRSLFEVTVSSNLLVITVSLHLEDKSLWFCGTSLDVDNLFSKGFMCLSTSGKYLREYLRSASVA